VFALDAVSGGQRVATVEDILLPDIGDFAEVEVIEILVAPGDRIQAEQSILTLESDKATIEIPSPKEGLVKSVKTKVGERVSQGDVLLTLETETSAPTSPASAPKTSRTEQPKDTESSTGPKPSSPRPGAEAETISVVLPDIGDFADIPVVEVLIAPGDRVEVDQSLLTLESDKATMEIPSPNKGIVEELAVKVGDRVLFGKYSGQSVKVDGDEVMVMREEDIMAIVEG
jgi:pyruvate dehydrogenase E2 component (dihydrolipoamide acetyltransferase)